MPSSLQGRGREVLPLCNIIIVVPIHRGSGGSFWNYVNYKPNFSRSLNFSTHLHFKNMWNILSSQLGKNKKCLCDFCSVNNETKSSFSYLPSSLGLKEAWWQEVLWFWVDCEYCGEESFLQGHKAGQAHACCDSVLVPYMATTKLS